MFAAGCTPSATPAADPTTSPAQTRTIDTVMGTVANVPAQAQRVVVLDADALDSAVTLGVKPVGAGINDVGEPISSYLPAEAVANITPVGTVTEPDVETIATLQPDLILGSKVRHEKIYGQLSSIAPTVFTETTGPRWRDNFRLHAEALGRVAEGEQVAADFDKQISDSVARLGGPEKVAGTTVGYTRFVAGDLTRLYLDDTFIGSILVDLGVGRPSNLPATGFSVDISPEQVQQANADVIFYSTYGSATESKETEITEGQLWKDLDAVKNNRAYAVDDDLYMLGIGYSGARLIVDDLTGKLGGA